MTPAFDEIVSALEREAWLEARRRGIGSSDAPAALGLSPWKSPLGLYAEKLGIEETDPDPGEPAYWGRVIEPLVLARFAQETARSVKPAQKLLRSKERPWQLSTLDGEQHDVAGRDGPGVVEVKCTSLGGRWDDGVPPYVMAQIQHQLAVTGWKFASVAVLFSGREFFWLDVERDDEMVAWLNEAERVFWERVERLEPPDPAGTEADRQIIGRLFPKDTEPEPLVLDGSFMLLDERRDEIYAEAKKLGAEALEIENRLRLAIGDHASAILPSGVVYTLKSQTRKAYEVPAATFRVLRRFEPKIRRGGE